MPRSISFHDSSYGSSPPAVLSWWLGAAKISPQDSKVFLKFCSLLFVFVFSFHYANIWTSKKSVEPLFVCFWTEDLKVIQVETSSMNITSVILRSWIWTYIRTFCFLLKWVLFRFAHLKIGIRKVRAAYNFGDSPLLIRSRSFSVTMGSLSIKHHQLSPALNYLMSKKETEKKTWLLLTENYNRAVFLGLIAQNQ